MKKIVLLLLLLLPTLLFSQGTISYTTGTSNDNSLPVYGLYNYSVSGFILLQSEIGTGSKEITNISIQFGGYTTPYTFNNQDIYLAHVSESEFDASPNVDLSDLTITNLTKCVNAQSLVISSNTWITLTFDTNFSYNGVDNLVILWENRDGSWGSGYGYAETKSTYTNRGFEKYADPSFPTGTGTRTSAIPNVKLDWAVPTALPIVLSKFSGYNNTDNILEVELSTKKDINRFVINNSVDGIVWDKVFETYDIFDYNYIIRHSNYENTINYYKVIFYDINNDVLQSKIISVDNRLDYDVNSINTYDILGRKVDPTQNGLIIQNNNGKTIKIFK